MDLAVGKDIETAYLETKDLNHVFRIIETVALRIKSKDAIIVLNKVEGAEFLPLYYLQFVMCN